MLPSSVYCYLHALWIILLLVVKSNCESILLVRSCQSAQGNGRCIPSPECCKLVGGAVVTPNEDQPCGSREVCCYIVPTVPDSDQSCSACAVLTANKTGVITTPAPSVVSVENALNTVDTALPVADDQANLIRSFGGPTSRDDLSAGRPRPASSVSFFARTAESGFGIPYRIERTIFDKDAMKDTYCWQVALVDSSGKIFGGGALVAKNYVLTAAHKVANRLPQNFQVVLGKYNFKDQEEDSRIASPLEVIIHENWDPAVFENNIALIRIPNVKCNGAEVCTICPSSRGLDPLAQAQDICFVTGWGSTYTKGELEKLQQNQISPISNDDCVRRLARSGIEDFIVPSTMFCGSSADPDHLACDGDGGGPLVCMQSGTWAWELRGLVALGVSQCINVTDAPTVYTDVGKLSGWIARKIQQLDAEKTPWDRYKLPTTPRTTTTTTTPTTTTPVPVPVNKAPILNRRTYDRTPMTFSYVFPSFLRRLEDNADDSPTY
ncbi:chymotrypsin-C-like [Paramacrobiotus metropolitanus]|uniref:chymotrypsin-C-like n=1 Tax=Paramacrobiotus metropolitanus TaxID=2943436 RepID=UPI0024464408|nr:chymotrypsin-C-like [Paramacrobiotus metropolitanus]